MDLKALQQRILQSDKSDAQKAQLFVNHEFVKQLTVTQWQTLMDGIPDEVIAAIDGLLPNRGVQLPLHHIDVMQSPRKSSPHKHMMAVPWLESLSATSTTVASCVTGLT